MRTFNDYDFAIEYLIHDEDTTRRTPAVPDLDTALLDFNRELIFADAPHDVLDAPAGTAPDTRYIDTLDLVVARRGDDYSWNTLISWGRERGFSFLPEAPADILSEVLAAVLR